MSIVTARPTPTKPRTTVLFDAARPSRSHALLFGLGLSHQVEQEAVEDRHVDRLYMESAMLDRYTRGHVC